MAKEHVIIEWLKPESDGGSEIKNYIVDKREQSSTRSDQVLKCLNQRLSFLTVLNKGSYILSQSVFRFFVQVDSGE